MIKIVVQIKVNKIWTAISESFIDYKQAATWAARLDFHQYRILKNGEVIFGIGD